MTILKMFLRRRTIAVLLLIGYASLASGCATIAHRHAYSFPNKSSEPCRSDGAACPWLVGDALLLIPGVLPGVIAFIVDFSTGEWQHDGG